MFVPQMLGDTHDVVDVVLDIWLTLLQNHENRTVEMLLSFSSDAERTKWVESVRPCPAVTGA